MEDEDQEESRFVKLGFKPQKEIIYNKLLPYADKLDEESLKLYTDIKTNLTKSIIIREMRPGCVLWTSRLNKYLKIYGLKFSKEDHIALIKLMYELITIPDLEPTRVNKFSATLTHLLKKKELLSPDELVLPWRPLYDLCQRLIASNATYLGMYRYFSSLNNNLNCLVHAARLYFPANSTQEMLDEWRPKLCPFDACSIVDTFELLEWFLPINLPPSKSHLGYELWFNEFMQYWEVCHNAPAWENDIMWLMARLASNNIGYIDWEPYTPLMFTRFLRSLDLPVSFQQKQSPKRHKIETSSMCIWIVSTIGNNSSTLKHLEKFMQTVESYYHSANSGRWSAKLRDLFRKLSYHFIERLHFERYKKLTWETPVPESHKITEADIDYFVEIMKPIVISTIYTRQGQIDINHALQHLATLRPNVIVPLVLDKIYSTLDSLTEPHKLTSSLQCLNAIARPLLQGPKNNYPDGPTHVIPLLISLLPGIDPNDILKCLVTFQFISTFIYMIPLVDSSNAADHWKDLTEEEHIICEATADLEDFVLQYLDKVFTLIESSSFQTTRLEQVDMDKKSKMEMVSESALASICTAIITQTSPEIFKSALRKFSCFVMEHIFETKVSGQMVAVMCRSFTKVNPDDTLKILLPHICDRINALLGDNDDMLKEENLDTELLYNLLLLSEMLECNGTSLLPYIDRLTDILDRTLHLSCYQGSVMASRLLNSILNSLTIVQPMEYKSSPWPYSRDIKKHLTIRDWGTSGNINKLKIQWYQPGPAEISCVQKLLNRYLPPELEKIDLYVDNKVALTREELRRSLCIVLAVLGCHTVLPMWDESPIELVKSSLDPWEFEMIIGPPPTVAMPDGRNVRTVVCNSMHKLQAKILSFCEDDTKSLFTLISIWDTLMKHHFRGRDFETHWKNFHIVKKLHKDYLRGGKCYLRQLLIDRVMLHQEFRIEGRSCMFSESHKQIMIDLYDLCVSHYSEVRIRAQKKLFSAISSYPYSYTVLTPYIVKSLQVDTNKNHEEFKGCLHVLLGPKGAPIVLRHDWNFIIQIWPLLIKSKPSEKPSVINLMSNIGDTIHKHFPTISIHLEIPNCCLESAKCYSESTPSIKIPMPTEEEIQLGLVKMNELSARNTAVYSQNMELILTALLEGNLHWRHHTRAMTLIGDLVHPNIKYNKKVVQFVLQTLIHESLELRKLAIRITVFIFKQHKRKHKKISLDTSKFNTDNGTVKPGHRKDNEFLQYNSAIKPLSQSEWDQPRFLHEQFNGFYVWPKTVEIYAPSKDQPNVDRTADDLTCQEKEIHEFFMNKACVDQLITYLSMEEKKGKDKFNSCRFMLFKNLFANHGDAYFDNIIPHLERLITNKEEHFQRCAAEIIAGLIRGSKHWPYDKVANMWSILSPIIRKALANMTLETISDWGICFATAIEGRDPNRHHWLYELLMEDPLRDEASFIECGRLYTLQGILNQQMWRVSELFERLLLYLKDFLMHPFQNVRERISSMLSNMLEIDINFPNGNLVNTPTFLVFMEEIKPQLNNLYAAGFKDTAITANNDCDGVQETSSSLNNLSINDNERDVTIRLFKTVSKLIIRSISRANYAARTEHYELFPLACLLQSYEADEELCLICSSLLAVLAQAFTLPKYIPMALASIRNVSNSGSWSARAVCAEYLQIFVFYNMASIMSNEKWVEEIKEIVLKLLEDEKPEVRVQASQVLSGLFHCHFILPSKELLENFKQKARTKLKHRHANVIVEGKDVQKIMIIRKRHAGVLGLCAFVNAHPYDVPEYIPEIFLVLGDHLNDPQPIPTTIRKTLGDFKRTHHDDWKIHRQKFTEDELSVLSDLTVPLSYYA